MGMGMGGGSGKGKGVKNGNEDRNRNEEDENDHGHGPCLLFNVSEGGMCVSIDMVRSLVDCVDCSVMCWVGVRMGVHLF
jgi:hypothetical protein